MKPTLIHSKILDDMICLSEISIPGKVCYNQKEIELLKAAEKSLGETEYAAYLKKIHSIKKVFPDSKIEDIKMDAPAPEPREKEISQEPQAPESEQKSLWEL